MLHAYVDESYSDDWFFMAAAIGSESQVATFENNLQWLVIETAEYHQLDPYPNELHGYELMQGIGAWREVPLPERVDLAAATLKFARDCGIEFIVRGLDREAQRRKYQTAYEPYPLVLTQLIKEVNAFAHQRGMPVSIVCDEIHHDDRHRAMLERHRREGTPGYSASKLQSVLGALEFVASSSSQMVQLADLVAYLKHRATSRPTPGRAEQRTRKRLWELVEGQVAQDYIWIP